MHDLWDELRNIRTWAMLIEACAGLLIGGYSCAAFVSLCRKRDRRRARQLIAEGALGGLSFILCATLLKTLLLTSWNQIGLFASVLVLRTSLKRIFIAEEA
jgi:uncharacterized membrane protein